MKEEFTIRANEVLQSIIVLSDEDVVAPGFWGEWCPYQILIKTLQSDGSTKTRQIVGCHDMGPELGLNLLTGVKYEYL